MDETISGAMYGGVPKRFWSSATFSSFRAERAVPKSQILAVQCSSRRMLAGLRSRW